MDRRPHGHTRPDTLLPYPPRFRSLVSFGTRHTLSDTKSDTRGIGAARRWIHAGFERISAQCGGCLEVIDVAGTISGEERIPEPTEVVSVLAIQDRKSSRSELQSLMRISYDVFCLKKTNTVYL